VSPNYLKLRAAILVQIHAKGYQFDTQTSEIKMCIIFLHIMLSLIIKIEDTHHCKETDHVYAILRTGHGQSTLSVWATCFLWVPCWWSLV